ncbi:MAG: oxidoreductase [Lentisphaerae bacterium GWF2_52_8]|nr:MAG: oxidoreductase [Lentisphaerae bacterium GWF2_52_8]
MRGLTGKTAFVTGGAQGIGRGITKRLLAEGMRVFAFDLDAEAGAELLAELAAGEKLRFQKGDVSNEDDVRSAITEAVRFFGSLDTLISNAAIFGPPPSTRLEDLKLGDWQRVLEVNLTGPLLCAKHAAPHLRKSKGAIVNIASTRALQSEPHTEPYSASKGGLLSLTHALAMSLAGDIRVNAICPGWIEVRDQQKKSACKESVLRKIDHGQHPAGRIGIPDDIAAAVAFLISEDAGFITGQNFTIDGGMTKKMIYAE